MGKYKFAVGGETDFFNSLIDMYQQQNQQDEYIPEESYNNEESIEPAQDDDYDSLLEKYNSLQQEHDELLRTQGELTSLTQPEGEDGFLDFLFSSSKRNLPLDFDQIDFSSEALAAPKAEAIRNTAGINPNVIQTEKDLFSQYNLNSKGIWGDKSHQQRKSDHNTGDAEDFGFDNKETALNVVNQLMQEAPKRGVKYIIYDKKIWNPEVSNEWRPYKGSNPHQDHIHVSYKR